MKILVEGTESEIERVQLAFNQTCLFNNKFCKKGMRCTECEEKQGLKIEFISKE